MSVKERSVQIALADVAKAFDSVSHQAIAEASLVARADPKHVRLVMNGYARQSSVLMYKGEELSVKPSRGVRQETPFPQYCSTW